MSGLPSSTFILYIYNVCSYGIGSKETITACTMTVGGIEYMYM